VNDVLAHTPLLRRHVGRQHLDDARRGAPDDPRHQPPDVDPRDGLPDRAFRPSLRAYTRQREELLGILERLPPEGWSRDATFTGAGKPVERTVLSQAQRIAVHERAHLKQVAAIADAMRS
jgi:hypothetical protein